MRETKINDEEEKKKEEKNTKSKRSKNESIQDKNGPLRVHRMN